MHRLSLLFLTLLSAYSMASVAQAQVRIPAEWETQQAVWMQWPRWYENSYRPAFTEIIRAAQAHQPVRIIAHSNFIRNQAQNYLQNRGVPMQNVSFEVMRTDNAWLRDNGPVWAEQNGKTVVEDWGFDGWGGDVGPWYQNDDAIPPQIAALENLPSYDVNAFIHERGNLEFNGIDSVILNWDCWSGRNPQLSQARSERILARAFGVSRVVWLYGSPEGDITDGHVDGMTRFINPTTVVVPRYWDAQHAEAQIYEDAAVACTNAGFHVLRMPIQGEITYRGYDMAANYVNWLVINDAVIMPGFGNTAWDDAAKQAVEIYFPGRTVYVVNTLELWYNGGAVHCVTNDQPLVKR